MIIFNVKAKPGSRFYTNYLGALLLVACFFLFGAQKVFAQAEDPYSRYGLGTIHTDVFSANQGMGYLAAPYVSALNINSANPASYASLTRTTFEIGAVIDGAGIIAKDSTYRASSGSVDHLVIALVPNLKLNNAAVVLGMVPYSVVNYNFLQSNDDSVIGPYNQSFIGSGQLYHVFVGGAFKIKGFSIGANVGYIFGKLQYQKVNAFADTITSNAYNTNDQTNMNAKGFQFTAGVQYQKVIYHNRDDPDARRDIYAFLGAYATGGTNLSVKVSDFWYRYNYNSSGDLVVLDTLQSNFNQKGTITMPWSGGVGAMFGNERFWMAGVDFKFTNWSSFTTPLDNGALANSWQVTFGGQVTPKYDDRGYLKRIQYRIGAYYGKTEYSFDGYHLAQAGATFGLGFPLWKSIGHLNFAGDFGSIGGGTPAVVLGLHENYYRFTVGLVLNDIWFVKRKFD